MTQKRGATGSVTPRFSGSIYVNDCCLASRAISAFYVFSVRQRLANVKGRSDIFPQVCRNCTRRMVCYFCRYRAVKIACRQAPNLQYRYSGARVSIRRRPVGGSSFHSSVEARVSAATGHTRAANICCEDYLFPRSIRRLRARPAARRSSHPCSARCPESRLIPHGAPRRSNPRIQV